VGALAHLLKDRFFIGEVAFRGEVHRGEHQPILDAALLEAVQGRLPRRRRRCRLRRSPALLTGRIFDQCGYRMSPTHANKRGARYRDYVPGRASEEAHGAGIDCVSPLTPCLWAFVVR